MLIKAGVDISRLNREIRRTLPKVQKVLDEWSEELEITSTYEGNHGEGSLHYSNDAYDMGLPKYNPVGVAANCRTALGKDFDIEGEDDHIHIEYDPE